MPPASTQFAEAIDELRRLRADAEAQWRRIDTAIQNLEQRLKAASDANDSTREVRADPNSLRGSVLWYGDIISPIDEKWDADT